jgi:hypothetical protein
VLVRTVCDELKNSINCGLGLVYSWMYLKWGLTKKSWTWKSSFQVKDQANQLNNCHWIEGSKRKWTKDEDSDNSERCQTILGSP